MIFARIILMSAIFSVWTHMSMAMALDSELIGEWINGLGDELIISPNEDRLRLEINHECYEAEVTWDEDVLSVEPRTPDIFCIPTPEGVSGSLDAVRAALPLVKGYFIEDDILFLTDEMEETLIAFDRIKNAED